MVTERICKIPQSDLSTIRVTCVKCNRAFETSIEDASSIATSGMCPLCGDRLFDSRNLANEPFAMLAGAMRRFEELKSKYAVEFVISEQSAECKK